MWDPSVHRTLTGESSDHALVKCTWKWRLKSRNRLSARDFKPLSDTCVDENGVSTANKTLHQFDDTVSKNLEKTLFDFEDDASTMYSV